MSSMHVQHWDIVLKNISCFKVSKVLDKSIKTAMENLFISGLALATIMDYRPSSVLVVVGAGYVFLRDGWSNPV